MHRCKMRNKRANVVRKTRTKDQVEKKYEKRKWPDDDDAAT
jgi:hypothetical protein